MRKINKAEFSIKAIRGRKNFLKSVKRNIRKKNRRRSEYNFISKIRKYRHDQGEIFYFGSKRYSQTASKNKPQIPEISQFIIAKQNAFSSQHVRWGNKGLILLPNIFSLTKAPAESYAVLKNLLFLLYKGKDYEIILDYRNCSEIDLDASVCMDIIIMEYNIYLNRCAKNKYVPVVRVIKPVNYSKPSVKKILFSIGAFRNVRGLKIDSDDMICYSLCIRNKLWTMCRIVYGKGKRNL
jgi:hypothetical protein